MADFGGDRRFRTNPGKGNARVRGGIKRELPRGGTDFIRSNLAVAHFQFTSTRSPS